MKATLFYDGPLCQRIVGEFVGSVPKFVYVFEAREWALRNGVAFVDTRYKHAKELDGGHMWQIVIPRVPRPIVAQMMCGGYVGVTTDRRSDQERWLAYLRPMLLEAMRREFWRSPEGRGARRRLACG